MNLKKSLKQNRCKLSTEVIFKFKLMRRNTDFFSGRDLKSTYNNPHYKTNTLA